MAEWERTLEVDPEAVRRIARPAASWRLLGSGWDADAWLADEAVVWRAPRREVAIAALLHETVLMPRIAPRLPAPVPVPERVDADGLPPLLRHAWIPGTELASGRAAEALGEQLGAFLRALHDPALATDAAALLREDPMGRADPVRRIPLVHRRLDDASAWVDVRPLRPIVDGAADARLDTDRLCHGDLHIRHVLADPHGALAGIIDWGDSCRSARAVDLAVVTALDVATRRRFFDAYGEVDAATWRHARMLGVMLGAVLVSSDPRGESGAGGRRWLERLVSDREPT